MASSSVITPEDVLESLMNDGTIDALRLKIINQLKANVVSTLLFSNLFFYFFFFEENFSSSNYLVIFVNYNRLNIILVLCNFNVFFLWS